MVATLGQRALAGTDFPLLLEQTVSLVADTLEVSAAVVCEVAEDGRLPVRAGHGLPTATDGQTCLGTDRTRFPASALEAETPVGESPDGPSDCSPEDRDPLLVQEGLSRTVAMRIPGRVRPDALLDPRRSTRTEGLAGGPLLHPRSGERPGRGV